MPDTGSTDLSTPIIQATTMPDSRLRCKDYLSTIDLMVLTLITILSLTAFIARILPTPGLNIPASALLAPLMSLGHFLNAVVTLEWVPTLQRHAVIYVMLLPTAALLITLARLTFGLRVLGFRSVLIAVGFQEVGLGPSLLIIAVVVGVIAAMRPWMRRIRLPLYARISLILAITAGIQIFFLMVGSWQRSHMIFNLAFFPVIILAMMAEGIAGTLDQSRPATAAWRLTWTLALALVLFGLMNFGPFLKLLLRAPELMILQIVAIVLIAEFLDFRLLQDWQNRATALISHFKSDSLPLPIQNRKKRVAVVRNKTSYGTIGRLGPQAKEGERNASLQHLIDALREQGYAVKMFEGDMTLLRELRKFLPPHPRTGAPGGVVLNMSNGIQGVGRPVHVPSLLEMAGVAYAGPDPLALSILCDRFTFLSRLRAYGLPVPDFRLIIHWRREPPDLPFPMVLRAYDTINDAKFIVRTLDEYSGALSHLITVQSRGILCEAWLEGTSISLGVLGNERLRCLPIASLIPRSQHLECPAPIESQHVPRYRSIAFRAFRSIGCRDFARVDMVVDRQGQAHVVGVYNNTILEKRGAMAIMAHAAGLSWPQLAGTIVELASARCGVDWAGTSQVTVATTSTAKSVITGTSCQNFRTIINTSGNE
ncbi:D-alanine--D-alanine ligase B [Microcystis aeruginosa NIES-3787]|uniref:D-alanine--D-alanine ligase B n=1 Tax=Microcystis aeruginosa NIES-3787 TaxID=2517782 RepID=A0A6H9GLJ5_MICAE|nr:D-alanine--D-alanine ligase B [Microcystis aeruginosa NIES-3787]